MALTSAPGTFITKFASGKPGVPSTMRCGYAIRAAVSSMPLVIASPGVSMTAHVNR